MNTVTDNSLLTSILTKCKVSLVCAFQEDSNQPVTFDKYELAYIIDKLRGDK